MLGAVRLAYNDANNSGAMDSMAIAGERAVSPELDSCRREGRSVFGWERDLQGSAGNKKAS
jgi:hypothetical protein